MSDKESEARSLKLSDAGFLTVAGEVSRDGCERASNTEATSKTSILLTTNP
jgi:hypothetical protein